MDKVFNIYLARQDEPECDAYVELSLPATPYQMQDALDRLRLVEGEGPYWEVTEYEQFEELAPVLNDTCGLYDLNALAQVLSGLDERQRTAFAGLLEMEQRKGPPIPISKLIDLAYSTDCCHVVEEVLNDAQLGRFYAKGGFIPDVDELPDEIFDLLDFERIAREHRQQEDGVLVARTADHAGGYVLRHSDLRQVYKTLDLSLKKPAYTILAETYSGARVELPYPPHDPMGTEPVRCADCAAPSLIGLIGGMESMNLLARRLAGMEPRELTAYKALLGAVDCKDLSDAGLLADTLDKYIFSSALNSPEEVAEEELNVILCEDTVSQLIPYVDLRSYGQSLLEQRGSVLTPYGLLERQDQQPIQSINEQPEQGGMEMQF